MSLTSENMTPADIAAVTGNNGWGNGNDWWIILFFLLAMNGGWGNNNGATPWMMNTDNDVERGFDQMSTMNGIGDLQNTISNGFSNTATQLCNGFAGVEQGANARQVADMNQTFGMQTAILQGFNGIQSQFAECCCENRLGVANLAADIAREACATRTADTQNTQLLLTAINDGFRQMSDQRFQDKIDAKNDEIAQLRQENLYARGQASQIAQNASIINGIYDRLNQCPVGTVPVYGEQPIFAVGNHGCGCNGNGF